ncbi:MAG: hypothetical protein MJ089_05240 [Ruminococcus sp.]|nr:hypothetical protein [Ruminococcus sp.]
MPYWNDKGSSYSRYCYWNSNSNNTDCGYIRNIMNYKSLNSINDLMNTQSASHYIAGLDINNATNENVNIKQISNDYDKNTNDFNTSTSNIIKYNIDTLLTETETERYALWNPMSDYSLSYPVATDFDVKMDYENIVYYVNCENGTYAQFSPSGEITFTGENANYDITILTENSACVSNWYALEIKGNSIENLNYKIADNGYILSATNLNDISIIAESREDTISKNINLSYDSIFIYETDNHSIGIKVDTNNDGIYETVVNK